MMLLAQAVWPESDVDTVPPLAGFIESTFSPLAAEVARRCMEGTAPVEKTAVIIVSSTGDTTTAQATQRAVDTGGRLGPLLFFQAVPNAVAGYIAAKWNLTGPVVCLSPHEAVLDDGLELAELFFRDGDAEAALIISIELGERDDARAVLVKGAV